MSNDKIIDHVKRALARLPQNMCSGDVAYTAPSLLNAAPTAGFAFSVNNLIVTLTDQSHDADGTIITWFWNFGDGTTSIVQNPVKTYAVAGPYTITLTVTDDKGIQASFSRSVTAVGGAAWTIDATKNVPIPQTLTEMNALLTSIGVASGGPTHAWLVGAAAAAPITDIIASGGAKNLADATAGGPAAATFLATRAGWSSKFTRFTGGASGARFANATFANVNANPYLMIMRAGIDAANVTKTVQAMGDTFDDMAAVEITTTPRVQLGEGAGASRKLGASDPIGGLDVCTFALLIEPATWNACVVYTSQEKLSAPGGGALANGTTYNLGGDNVQTWFPPTMDVLDAWIFEGAAARKTVTEIRAIIGALENTTPPVYGWNVVKTAAGAGAYDAGVRSTQTFVGDVYMECEVGTATNLYGIGLSTSDPDQNYTSIGFGFLLDAGNTYRIEAGALTALGTAIAGDVFRVSRESGVMKLYKNGALAHTFGSTTASALLVDTSLRSQWSTIHNVKVVAAGTPTAITWTNAVNATAY